MKPILENALVIERENPYTFWRPSSELLGNLVIGDKVKLIFNPSDPSFPQRRAWVSILTVSGYDFTGMLSEELSSIYIDDSHVPFSFSQDHIIDTNKDDPFAHEHPAVKYSVSCACSNLVLHGSPVLVACKEEPTSSDDSGWSFLAGEEDDSFMESSANWSWVPVGSVISMDPIIRTLVDSASTLPSGTKFIRDGADWIVEPPV